MCFCSYLFTESFCLFLILSFVFHICSKYFHPASMLYLNFVNGLFSCIESFSFDILYYITFPFQLCGFRILWRTFSQLCNNIILPRSKILLDFHRFSFLGVLKFWSRFSLGRQGLITENYERFHLANIHTWTQIIPGISELDQWIASLSLWYCIIVLEHVIRGGGTQDLSVFYLMTAYKSTTN